MIHLRTVLFLSACLAAGACNTIETFTGALEGATPYEQYATRLQRAELDRTAVGRTWLQAGETALDSALVSVLPYKEISYLDPSVPAALGYRFSLERGQQLHVQVGAMTGDSAAVFIDLFELPDDGPVDAYDHIETARDSLVITYNVRRTADYVVRVQPELLRGGRFEVSIWTGPSISFPVAGLDNRAVGSIYGDPRDGGGRRHEGIDIFAPRGTPVVAVADGWVVRTGTNNLGGKVVWLRDEAESQTYYYAHLDTQLVEAPRRVSTGDTLGLVGNTGNARYTPPHLHFGIYSNGALNPFPFVNTAVSAPPVVRADTSRLGRFVRVSGSVVPLKTSPQSSAPSGTHLAPGDRLFVRGSAGTYHRVELPDGRHGYVASSSLADAEDPLRNRTLATVTLLQSRPSPAAPPVGEGKSAEQVSVLGRYGEYEYVRTSSGDEGWILLP